MRLAFLHLPLSERALYFEQTALRRNLLPAIMEKDFWVCWLLSVLFADPEFNQVVVFKGGTSLSKVFGVIQRFSEDIDLSLAPAYPRGSGSGQRWVGKDLLKRQGSCRGLDL